MSYEYRTNKFGGNIINALKSKIKWEDKTKKKSIKQYPDKILFLQIDDTER